jgi:DNA modification methylase
VSIRILTGDCREVLRTLPDESVHCVVTSPPYFGLRDYGTAKWEGGDEACSHEPPQEWIDHNFNANSGFGSGAKTQSAAAKSRWYVDGACRCGARRIDSQIGLEPTPDAYVVELVAVFREVRRVLRLDGTLWLNLGDSYNTSGGVNNNGKNDALGKSDRPKILGRVDGLKPKDLIGIPWRVAFALQADGWWLRSEIIWAKPNPMPESVTDRPTKAHEQIFLLTKSATYWYDAEAIKEPAAYPVAIDRQLSGDYSNGSGRNDSGEHRSGGFVTGDIRNRRSVWTVPSQPFSEAHFATFPPALIEPCIKAGCPKDGTVLDPFGGAGTTGLVADRLGRNAILIELNPEYAAMAERRLHSDAGMFAEVVAA